MRQSQKAKLIFSTCMLAVGIFSAVMIYKTLRPSPGKPYEQITVEQALEYMEYEENYIFCDVGTQEEYEQAHITGAVNIPYESLGDLVLSVIDDTTQQIYLYARDQKTGDKAAKKLCEMGYINVTEVGTLKDWSAYPQMLTQAL